MRIALFGVATIIGLLMASGAEAAILYTTTDIGTNYTFLSGAGGQDYGVTGSDGITYAFNKTPVTKINVTSDSFASGEEVFTRLTMQAGAYQVGVSYGQGTWGLMTFPSFGRYASGWASYNSGLSTDSLVSDVNMQGQVVGASYIRGSLATLHFAAFSAIGVQSHEPNANALNSAAADNLNNYIAAIPGVTLTSAVAIDDLGRIIAYGSNGQDYLLTPEALGAPAPVPEPSTGLILGLAGSLLGLRSVRRQWVRRVACSRGA